MEFLAECSHCKKVLDSASPVKLTDLHHFGCLFRVSKIQSLNLRCSTDKSRLMLYAQRERER